MKKLVLLVPVLALALVAACTPAAPTVSPTATTTALPLPPTFTPIPTSTPLPPTPTLAPLPTQPHPTLLPELDAAVRLKVAEPILFYNAQTGKSVQVTLLSVDVRSGLGTSVVVKWRVTANTGEIKPDRTDGIECWPVSSGAACGTVYAGAYSQFRLTLVDVTTGEAAVDIHYGDYFSQGYRLRQ